MRKASRLEVPSPCAVLTWCLLAFSCTGAVEDPALPGSQSTAGQASAGNGPSGGSFGSGGNSSASGAGSSASRGGSGAAVSNGGAANPTAGQGGASASQPLFPNPPAYQPPPGSLRRLTRTQFRNAVRDVFGVETSIADLDSDSWDGNFATIGATTVKTSERGVEQYQTAIESAVGSVFSDSNKRSKFMGCTPSGAATDACLRGFIQTTGLRAWRRPLDSSELDRLMAIGTKAAADLGNAVEGARWVTVALFTSPHFIYRPELGTSRADGKLHLTGYEVASRLAFLLWNSLPDKQLLDDAQKGTLDSIEGIRAAATRLLDAPAGREAVAAFAEEYMRLDRVGAQAKDPTLFPEYGPALQDAMVRDVRETWASLVFDDRASALELFSTTKVLVNAELAKLYGIDASGLTSTTFQMRALPADGLRLGILSKAAFLSEFANQKEGSPTLRGKFMRDALMCTPIPPPPPDVNLNLQEPPADQPLTKRQRLEIHRSNPTCSSCHALMDPLGLPLENFDAIGRYRSTDHGLTIDPSGAFNSQAVADARGLSVSLASNTGVAQCLLRKYYSYALGHEERDADGAVLNQLASSFQASGFKLRDLIVDLVTHEAFSSVAPQP